MMNRKQSCFRTAVVLLGVVSWAVVSPRPALGEDWNWEMSICVDPGHGGPNACQHITPSPCQAYGAHGPDGLTEDWVNHDIAPQVVSLWAGNAVITRSQLDSLVMTPQARAEIANSAGSNVLVSIHHNSYADGSGEPGSLPQKSQTYYADTSTPDPEWSYKLADAILDRARGAFEFNEEASPRPDTESGPGSLGILRNANMPATLVEASNIWDHDEEDALENDAMHRAVEAFAIAAGIADYEAVLTPQGFTCVDWYQEYRYELEWEPVTGADGYVLYCYRTWDNYLWAKWDVMWSSCNVGYDELFSYTCFYFVVRPYAEGSAGRVFGGYSRLLDLEEECIPMGVSRSIWDFTATGGEHQISLTWKATDFDEGEGFYVYRSTNGGQCYDCDPSLAYVPFDPEEEDYSFVDTSTAYNTTYFYKILDTEGNDWWGPAFAAPTGGVESPPSPSPSPDLAVYRLGDAHVHLCLEEGSQYAAQYRVSWKAQGGSWAEALLQGDACLEKPDLENGTVYVFRAVAENISGQTAPSAEVSAMPMPPPTNFEGAPGNESIYLWWDEVVLASGYRVYYSTDPSNLWAESEDVGNTTEATLTGLENGVLYYTRVVAYDQFGNETEPSNSYGSTPRAYLAAPQSGPALPKAFALGVNRPNPFNPSTVIPYDLPSPCERVRLDIYDVRGARVRTLVDGQQAAGTRAISWDGTDGEGRVVPPGVYFYRLEADGRAETQKMVLVK